MAIKTEQHRLGISDETMESMKLFFLKTSIPRILKEKEATHNVNKPSTRTS